VSKVVFRSPSAERGIREVNDLPPREAFRGPHRWGRPVDREMCDLAASAIPQDPRAEKVPMPISTNTVAEHFSAAAGG